MSWSPTGEAIIANKGAERIKKGQLNIYLKWLKEIRGPVAQGDLVVVRDNKGEFLALGFYEGIGAIAVRILSRDMENLPNLLRNRLEASLKLRDKLKLDNFFRWIHSEADGLPGLIVDVYDDVVVISSTSIGFDKRLKEIASLIRDVYRPSSIVLRNDTRTRKEVNLLQERGLLLGDKISSIIREGGALFKVDALEGQKTGFFIDQRLNRIEIGDLVSPKNRVLDLFSYTGGFSIHAALSGAQVIAVDESKYAIRRLKENSRLNSVRIMPFQSRVKEFLEKDTSIYDMVIVDPPALAQSRNMIYRATKTYIAVNAAAMERVANGGLMFTSSCSQFISKEALLRIIGKAANLANKYFKILGERGASPDHPTDPNHPWTSYLKGFLLQLL